MAVRNYNDYFSKPIRQVHKNAGIHSQNPVNKSKSCECSYFCEEKQKISLLVYHFKGIRVPQFGNHCFNALLHSNLGNGKSDAGNIECSRRLPTLGVKFRVFIGQLWCKMHWIGY